MKQILALLLGIVLIAACPGPCYYGNVAAGQTGGYITVSNATHCGVSSDEVFVKTSAGSSLFSLDDQGDVGLCGFVNAQNGFQSVNGSISLTNGGLSAPLGQVSALSGIFTDGIETGNNSLSLMANISSTQLYWNTTGAGNTLACFGPLVALTGYPLQSCQGSNFPVDQVVTGTINGGATTCVAGRINCVLTAPVSINGAHQGCYAENIADGSDTQDTMAYVNNSTTSTLLIIGWGNYGVTDITSNVAVKARVVCTIS